MKYSSAVLIGHNGLGDNITMIGAINYLLNLYEKIYFICRTHNKKNVDSFFINKPVIIKDFKNNEVIFIREILNELLIIDKNIDILPCGLHKKNIKLKINNILLKNYKQNNSYDSFNKFGFINNFYKDINLDSSIYFNYFNIYSTNESLSLLKKLDNYEIIFIHTKSSNKEIKIKEIEDYKNINNKIIICPNENIYEKNNNKYELAKEFVNLRIIDYIDIIKNALEIYVVDSCFSCIINPLNIKNKLKSKITKIITR